MLRNVSLNYDLTYLELSWELQIVLLQKNNKHHSNQYSSAPEDVQSLHKIYADELYGHSPLIILVILSDSSLILFGLLWMVVIWEKSGPDCSK